MLILETPLPPLSKAIQKSPKSPTMDIHISVYPPPSNNFLLDKGN